MHHCGQLTRETDVFGRFCATLPQGGSNVSCCLPCPLADWVYSDNFPTRARDSNYVAIVMLILNLFLLLSFAVLPKAQSHRHYLSTGLVVSLVVIAIAFIIPLGSDSDQCYDRITPNDLQSSVACGFTGSLVEIGAMGVVVWSRCIGQIAVDTLLTYCSPLTLDLE